MHTAAILLGLAIAASSAAAHPGMKQILSDLTSPARVHAARAQPRMPLPGNLDSIPERDLNAVGRKIKATLEGRAPYPPITKRGSYTPPGELGSEACCEDACCVYSYALTDTLNPAFAGCTDSARAAIRLGFHDAGAWYDGLLYGGADGSILLTDELYRSDNNGLDAFGETMKGWYWDTYAQYNASMADLIQLGAIAGALACPGGPFVTFYAGRPDDATEPPTGLLPSPFQLADYLIDLFANKTISVVDLVALLGAHSTSKQFFVDTSLAGEPQDSTPTVWDTDYYAQTLAAEAPEGVFRFDSDVSLANSSEAGPTFVEFAAADGGFDAWVAAYSSAYLRLSLLGVSDVVGLTDCSSIL